MQYRSTAWESMLPKHVEIIEVGPRDGFQILTDFIETSDKIRVIESVIAAGLQRIEVTSFVHPKAVPQMRDAAEVLRGLQRGGCQCIAMTPNLKGAERALEAGADMLNLVLSASESHNRSNLRMSIAESLANVPAIIALARGKNVPVRASISTAFGCPFEGDVPQERLLDICRRLVGCGCEELNLCDTTGMANPLQVARTAEVLLAELSNTRLVFHFHNTRGAGAANLLSALQNGITSFETSLGGLGGCPFAPGASGNISTEDMVYMLQEMGIQTGINLPILLAAVRDAEKMLRIAFPGQLIKAGPACDLHPLL
jgi:hydroxymethylglutaryl-CoA lyase